MKISRLNKLFAYVHCRTQEEKNFLPSMLKMYRRNAFYCRYIGGLLKFFNRLPKQPKYVFISNRFRDLIEELPRDEVLILGGPKQAFYCWKHGIAFWSNCNLRGALYNSLRDQEKISLLEPKLHYLTEFFKNNLNDNAVVIAGNDSLPMERLHMAAACNAGFLTICIQDGLFQLASQSHIIHGKFADKMFVFDQHFCDLLIDKGVPAERISVMGYHSNPYKPKRNVCKKGNLKVCFLGGAWRHYNIELHKKYFNILIILFGIFRDNGIECYYKPHPLEHGEQYLNKIDNVFNGNLNEAFEQFDVFVSLTSTALYEATLAGRVAIQIIAPDFQADDFAKYGYAYSIEASTIGDILNLLNNEPLLLENTSIDSISVRFKKCL